MRKIISKIRRFFVVSYANYSYNKMVILCITNAFKNAKKINDPYHNRKIPLDPTRLFELYRLQWDESVRLNDSMTRVLTYKPKLMDEKTNIKN